VRAKGAAFGPVIGGGAHDTTGFGVAGVLGVQGCDSVPEGHAPPQRGVPGAAAPTALTQCSRALPLTSRGSTGAGGAAIPLLERPKEDGADIV
jgi:hypothetical protein